MTVFLWIIGIIGVLLAVPMLDLLVGWLVLRNRTRCPKKPEPGPGNRRLIMYYPGILADGIQSSLSVMPTWQRYGDVLAISYLGWWFNGKQTASNVVDWIEEHRNDYDEVVFIGSSMGGLLVYDTVTNEKFTELGLTAKLVLIDAPTRRADLQSPLDKVSLLAFIAGGPFSNLFSRAYFEATFVAPEEENIEDGVDRDELAERVKEAKSFPLSINNCWVRYIVSHGRPDKELVDGFSGVYVRSLRDHGTTRPEAFESWSEPVDGMMPKFEVDSTHVGYNERPDTWQKAFPEIFRIIAVD